MTPAARDCLADIDVAILAGGLGTRIRPVLGDVPKVLAPVNGRPFLALLFDWLAGFGARRVVLCLGHLADRVEEYLGDNPPAMEVVVRVEPEPLGTAGALRFARDAFHSDPVLVLNGDSFVDADLCAFAEAYRAVPFSASLVCAEVPDTGRFGEVEITADNSIKAFHEKDGGGHPGTINAGIYLLSAGLLDDIAAGQAASLEREIFPGLAAGALTAFHGPFDCIDIGTPDDLARAGAVLAAHSPAK